MNDLSSKSGLLDVLRMKNIGWLVVSSFCFTSVLSAETLPPLTNGVPQNVEELWAEIDLESPRL